MYSSDHTSGKTFDLKLFKMGHEIFNIQASRIRMKFWLIGRIAGEVFFQRTI